MSQFSSCRRDGPRRVRAGALDLAGHKREQNAQTRANPKKINLNCSTSAGARLAQTTHDKMGPSGPTDSQRMVKVSACVIQTLPGLEKLGNTLFEGKSMRQIGRGQVDDKGKDISGYFVVADGGAAVIFTEKNNAIKWANNQNQVNIEIAPSLTYVDSGHSSVSLFIVD